METPLVSRKNINGKCIWAKSVFILEHIWQVSKF